MTESSSTPTYILGISAFYHDSAAALICDGKIVAAASEERFTRKKGDASFPREAVSFCLNQAGISLEDLHHVVFYEKPWLHFERILETHLAHAPLGLGSFLKSIPIWLRSKLFMRKVIRKELGWKGPVLFCKHHDSHMSAAFYPSPFEEAAILTVDGVGEWATTSWGIGRGSKIEVQGELHFPHSIGLLYAAFTAYLGFKVNEGEYKVMGLAPYGAPRFADKIRSEMLDVREDGSFKMNMKYFAYGSKMKMFTRAFEDLMEGPSRKPDSQLEQHHLDVAASIQIVTEEILLSMVQHVHQETGLTKLVLGGGVALNCVANGRILRESPIESIWIQPAAGDAGSALGAAMTVWHQYLDGARTYGEQGGSLLGPEFDQDAVRSALDAKGLRFTELDEENIPLQVAKLLAKEKIVGFFSGRMEFGPRALGARSILADPRAPDMQSRLNQRIKKREDFRPFAPAVLEEHAGSYFELDHPSPFMQFVAPVHPKQRREPGEVKEGLDQLGQIRSTIPAVTHVNHSARIQTLGKESHDAFRAVVEAFYSETGCPVVLNTSFNERGEPIVCTPEDAIDCFERTGLDALVIDRFVVLAEAGA
jgi:carbamoyltransferase